MAHGMGSINLRGSFTPDVPETDRLEQGNGAEFHPSPGTLVPDLWQD